MYIKAEEGKRIKKLIAFMEALPRAANKHFDMGAFLFHDGDHEHEAPKKPADLLHSCGTSACALGWAATMPYFQKLGLKFSKGGVLRGRSVIVPSGSWKWAELFGGWNDDRTPKQWAKRAKGLLKEWDVR